MVHLGSWFVPDGGASGFHDVYTEKSAVEAFRETGEFPDGATVVKELRAHSSGDFTTGSGVSHATRELKQWFVMIKDSENRFSGNKIWGDGWGWPCSNPAHCRPTHPATIKRIVWGVIFPQKTRIGYTRKPTQCCLNNPFASL
nr:cytochrome P460 family protein [Enterovibrio nigricans]